ncbi:zinc-binding dehydrogenase [Micromonospora sp. M12]
MNFLGIDSPGAMQSSWTVPAELVLPLPEDLPLDHAALVEPVAVAVHDVRRGTSAPTTRLSWSVVGRSGPHRHRRPGPWRAVLLVEPDPFRREVAEGIGIEAVDPGSTDVVALVNDRTDGAGADIAFEVSGSAAGVTTAVDVLTTRGRLVMVAIHPKPREVNLHRFFWRELELLGARLYQRDDMVEAIRLVASGEIPARQLISRVEPVEAAGDAFAALEGGGVMKVLLDVREGDR